VKLLSDLERTRPIFDTESSSTAVLSNLTLGAPRRSEDSLIAFIHLLELTSRMDYRRILEQPVARWIAMEWTKVVNTQQFGIANPRINGPCHTGGQRVVEGQFGRMAGLWVLLERLLLA
jgi:hypothetical protein